MSDIINYDELRKIEENSRRWEELVKRVWTELQWTPTKNHVNHFFKAIRKGEKVDEALKVLEMWAKYNYEKNPELKAEIRQLIDGVLEAMGEIS